MRIFHVREENVPVESVPKSMFNVNWLSPGVMSTYTSSELRSVEDLHFIHVSVLTVLISVDSADTGNIVRLPTDGKQINLALRVVCSSSLRSGYRIWSSNHEINEIQSEYL